MGEWLKNNVHLATWLSPIIALVGIIVTGGVKGGQIDWARGMLYIGFLTCLAAAFTQTLNNEVRVFACVVVFLLGIVFVVDVFSREGMKLPSEHDSFIAQCLGQIDPDHPERNSGNQVAKQACETLWSARVSTK